MVEKKQLRGALAEATRSPPSQEKDQTGKAEKRHAQLLR
jgi:hypothetical protein